MRPMRLTRPARSWTNFSGMTEGPVAFIDSGVGGLPYLDFTRQKLPGERFVYAADRENFPYGTKEAGEITRAVVSLTERLLRRETAKLVVVACNTASVVSLAELRRRFSVPFVGVVPAVKPAAAFSARKRIGVLATQRTVEAEYLRGLIRRFAVGCDVAGISAGNLVDFVEHYLHAAGPDERRSRVRAEVDKFRDADVDIVVLACTHFLHLEEEFRAELGQGIRIIDSREGVAMQVARLSGVRTARQAGRTRRDSFYLTGPAAIEERYRFFARKFDLDLEGTI